MKVANFITSLAPEDAGAWMTESPPRQGNAPGRSMQRAIKRGFDMALGWDDRIKLDVWYVRNFSLWLDLKILALTAEDGQRPGITVKRGLDIIVYASALVLLFPVLTVLRLMVRSRLGRPVLFVQESPDLHGCSFKLLKFHTMKNAANAQGYDLSDSEWLVRFVASHICRKLIGWDNRRRSSPTLRFGF